MHDALVKELANRRCIIFLGSGASASAEHRTDMSKRSPNWEQLLRNLAAKVAASNRSDIEGLIEKKRYLEAAEKIRAHINPADFSLELGNAFNGFKPSRLHEIVGQLDQYVVATTNYDKIYEIYCQQGVTEGLFTTCKYYETKLVSDLRSSKRLILKLHGCLDDPERTILTRSEYYKLRRDHGRFFDVINALFLTHTVLFIGYSIDDPDIQLILENTNITAQSTFPHYALLQQADIDNKGWYLEKIHNVMGIPYPDGQHVKAIEILDDLKDAVLQERSLLLQS